MVKTQAIINVIKQMSEKNEPPCKKALQKMVFLIQAKGIDLGCDYGIHFYGPYSADLDFAVRGLNDKGVLAIDYTDTGHKISVVEPQNVDALEDLDMTEIIAEFVMETPSNLELLTTALFVYLESKKNIQSIKPGVLKIKGLKYTPSEIDAAITRLQKVGYVS